MDSLIEMISTEDSPKTDNIKLDVLSNMHTDNMMFWYRADSQYGCINIGLNKYPSHKPTKSSYKETVLDQIQTLSREEATIRKIEEWLEEGIDLRPIDNIEGFSHTLKVSNRNYKTNSINSTIVIKVNKDSIEKFPVPNWHLDKNLYIDSSNSPVQITLSSLTIDKKNIESINKDNVLLIPDSFSDDWFGYAKAVDLTSKDIMLKVGDSLQSLYINNVSKESITDELGHIDNLNNSLQIVIDKGVEIPFHLLLGWEDTSHYILNKRLTSHSVKVLNNNSCIALGRLIPISNGFGVYIDSIL
ncbi:MAG: hypothetical protein JAY85_14965 [Candidatus Thiodiazotropha weberae]|uniref:Uncharacterized protein n=1 Tax=Candidatus Thiodiazotropha endoloripes TaxID=1818881 RepID=A0A1E2USS1_9GAMM|nr:hypothetical protein [Candidatus Thiodiazotropha endoloripes]MCG7899741.1 hypothetical protein [Candidatus Thiodiazotropha weberae]MCG7901282.1 hypothetical protein [Candidatus Thiodiazotropha weberae]ODB97786.1 hypothetical protein A3196_14090 [Candidatus Thiodiazotropha endoloripes]